MSRGRRPARLLALLLLLATATGEALAQTTPVEPVPGHEVDLVVDGAITGGALAGSLAMMLWPVDRGGRWQRELFGALDVTCHRRFSSSAAKLSDALVAVTLVAPAALNLGPRADEAAGQRMLLYAEGLGVNLLLNTVVKYLVQRPRPYTYSGDPRIAAIAVEQGADSRLSFYSAHSAMTFGAAVTGSYLYAAASDDPDARAVVWGTTLALAASAANLRVRAGKHFYSDVAVGALVGAGIGFAVPALHATGDVIHPSGREVAAMAGGLVLGVTVSELLPLDNDFLAPLGADAGGVSATLTAMPLPSGGGVGLIGSF